MAKVGTYPAIEHASESTGRVKSATIAWAMVAIYYFYQYVLRSAPSVMMPQLANAFGVSAISVASIVGLFYYGYSPFSLVAGAAMDRLGPRSVLPIGAVIKEANPPEFGGTAAGVINFLNFSFSALLGPVFAGLLEYLSRGTAQRALVHYQTAFLPLLFGVVGAIGLSFLLKETGPAVQSVNTQ